MTSSPEVVSSVGAIVSEQAKEAQLSKEADARIPRGVVYPTLKEAHAACDAHDKALGLPNAAMTRWTEPIELEDGWLVQSPDRKGAEVDKARIKVRDESEETKPRASDDPKSAELARAVETKA